MSQAIRCYYCEGLADHWINLYITKFNHDDPAQKKYLSDSTGDIIDVCQGCVREFLNDSYDKLKKENDFQHHKEGSVTDQHGVSIYCSLSKK